MKNVIRETLKLVAAMFIATATVAAALGAVNSMTRDIIAENRLAAMNEAMNAVMEGCTFGEPSEAGAATVYAASRGSQTVGVVCAVTVKGFGGDIEMIVGVSRAGKITGVLLTSLSETAGLGAEASDPEWLSQYVGLTEGITVSKRGVSGGDNAVDAITAATITSESVTSGVNLALEAAASYFGGAGR